MGHESQRAVELGSIGSSQTLRGLEDKHRFDQRRGDHD